MCGLGVRRLRSGLGSGNFGGKVGAARDGVGGVGLGGVVGRVFCEV